MDPLLECIARFANRHGMFPPGAKIGLAVSGGADSVFLLHALHALAPRWNLRLSVLHLDHGWRAGSAADATFVQELAASMGLPFHLRRESAPKATENQEEAGRAVRRRFFEELRATEALAAVATGHTRSDQAETVLFRLLRGSGPSGLAAILPVTREGLIRPLLATTREEIVAWLQTHGLPWREDPTNADSRFARNRIRHETLPKLAADYNPNLTAILAHAAAIAQDEEAYWANEIEIRSARYLKLEGRAVFLDTAALCGEHPAVTRRLLREAIRLVRGDLRRIDFEHLERLLELSLQKEGDGRLILPGVDAFRSFGIIRLTEPGADLRRPYEVVLSVPGCTDVAEAGFIDTELVGFSADPAVERDYNESEAVLDWDLLAGPLVVRNWEPGDRYRPAGRGSETLVKTLFQEAGVPIWERKHWPVITARRQIVWVQRFGPSETLAPGLRTRTILRIRRRIRDVQ
ncbi:MAG: tRNA lysidine(34) synthetase TilS [Bryobacteraceae bacterium]|nr:tRNA lysidine(34) synthetase TilS [Bryobacteraceae bacterium]